MRPVTIAWPGGEHPFRLRLGELRALQEATKAGPEELLTRVRLGRWQVDDLIEILRWGLIGGGAVAHQDAAPMVVRLMEQSALLEFKMPAELVLMAALLQPEGDELGKETAGETETSPDSGVSPASTETAP